MPAARLHGSETISILHCTPIRGNDQRDSVLVVSRRHPSSRQRHPRHKHRRSNECWEQVRNARVADWKVDADRRAEAGHSGDGQGLPQAARGAAAPDAEEHGEAAAGDAAAETGAVVGDQRDEARVQRVDVGDAELHEFEVGRYEDRRHPHGHDDRPAEHQRERRRQQECSADPIA